MDWKELSDERLGAEITRLEQVARDVRAELDDATRERDARKYGIAIGETVEVAGVPYERVASPWSLKLRKVGGKAGRYAYNWNKWKAGECALPW